MNQIREYFSEIVEMSDADWNLFSIKLQRVEFPRKHILLRTGQVENFLSFVEFGVIRYYVPKEEGEVTFDFAFSNSFTSGYSSFITQLPAIYEAETLTKTVLWRISYKDLQTVYLESASGNLVGRLACEALFLKKTKREVSLLNRTPEERYLDLLNDQPQLLQHIPLQYIASYIGITPQALSRIRKRIS